MAQTLIDIVTAAKELQLPRTELIRRVKRRFGNAGIMHVDGQFCLRQEDYEQLVSFRKKETQEPDPMKVLYWIKFREFLEGQDLQQKRVLCWSDPLGYEIQVCYPKDIKRSPANIQNFSPIRIG